MNNKTAATLNNGDKVSILSGACKGYSANVVDKNFSDTMIQVKINDSNTLIKKTTQVTVINT
ncbi:MAG TPA: hypothetical protein VKR58_06030 [Aquella sp.]|nr:hypothetical protein [Aquella sp.]